MGAAVGTDDKKSVNVDVNIVPFIDLLSCLTAFLLVTAAWTKIAALPIAPEARAAYLQRRIVRDLARLAAGFELAAPWPADSLAQLGG